MIESSKLDQLVQQHILEHESRLKHMDELLERAGRKMAQTGEGPSEQLASMKLERDELSGRVREFKLKPPEQWSEEDFERTGPMVVWDTLAQKLEKLVERLER